MGGMIRFVVPTVEKSVVMMDAAPDLSAQDGPRVYIKGGHSSCRSVSHFSVTTLRQTPVARSRPSGSDSTILS